MSGYIKSGAEELYLKIGRETYSLSTKIYFNKGIGNLPDLLLIQSFRIIIYFETRSHSPVFSSNTILSPFVIVVANGLDFYWFDITSVLMYNSS